MPGRTKRINCRSCESTDLAPKSALCRTCDNARRRQNRLDNLEREKLKQFEWRQNNKDHCREYKRNYYNNNKERVNDHRRNWIASSQNIQIIRKLYSKFHHFLRGDIKLFDYLGCDVIFFKKWIEFQFDDFMNWDNYNTYWVYDHVIPTSNFNLSNEDEARKCFNWVNVRPISRQINSIKNNKIIQPLIWLQEYKSKLYLLKKI